MQPVPRNIFEAVVHRSTEGTASTVEASAEGASNSMETIITYTNGDTYIGQVDTNGKREGKGIMRKANGGVYDGQFKGGMRHGKGGHRNDENVVAHHGNAVAGAVMGSNDRVGVTSPLLHHHRTNYNNSSYDNNNEYRRGNEREEQVYSPHLAALSSPPLTYTTHAYEDDGLLHSIFSAKKQKKKRTRRRGRNVNCDSQDKSEEDVLGLFSPGVQEFDLEEALAEDDYYDDESEPIHTHKGEEERRDNNEDEVTLDSDDRIVRGDYLECNQRGGGKVASAAKATTVSFTSPPATATGSTPPAATGATAVTTTPVIDNTFKTPNYSTPYNSNNEEEDNEYFYTPVQHKSDNIDWAVMSTTSRGGGSMRHGEGKYTSADGDVYDGEWSNNMAHGKGKMKYKDGTVYDGEFMNNKKHGKGKMKFMDDSVYDVYDGEWSNNKKHGKGKMKFKDGQEYAEYDGEWCNGLRHGKGKMKFEDGLENDGEWFADQFKGGMFHGEGKYTWADGRKYDGEWQVAKVDEVV
eukprot:scaffold16402_cov86-Skeletonema_dohrnii-CCMP3373.AAC.4